MNGNELFSKIILGLNTYLTFNDQDLKDLIEIDDNLKDGITWLQSLNPPAPFDSFIEALEKLTTANKADFLNTPYTNLGTVTAINFTQPNFHNRNRRIAFSNSEFSFVSSQAIFDAGTMIDLANDTAWMVWQQVEEFLERCYSAVNNVMIKSFFDMLATYNTNIGLVVNKTGIPFNEEQHYSYIYLSFLNDSNSTLLPTKLKYSPTNLYPLFTYDSTKNYSQYFDIYDVLNDLNQAPDILNRFLRLFHTMEYLVYRVYLVNLVTRVGSSRLFVREFISSAESMSKGERDAFIKNFSKIFEPDMVAIIDPAFNTFNVKPIIDFLEGKKIVKGFSSKDVNKISSLIYGIRCSIVHNKESEYHMTISNSEEYDIIIPLIVKVLEIFENLVVKKIIENQSLISYTQNTIALY